MVSINKSSQIDEDAEHQIAKEEKKVITAKGEQDKKSQIKSDRVTLSDIIADIIELIVIMIFVNICLIGLFGFLFCL